ncbi:MAG: type IV pilus secretin PilQ [Betaproteobacteria bacterium]|nr:MAG: type IV pilus secretin PilQ [Betaproteobacteria bacterium]
MPRTRIMSALVIAGTLLLVPAASAQERAASNAIQALEVSSTADKVVVKMSLARPVTAEPISFALSNPPRIALDFADTANALGRSVQDVNQGGLRSIRLGQSGGRTRVVLNMMATPSYVTRVEGNTVAIVLDAAATTAQAPTTPETVSFATGEPAAPHSIRDVHFQRGRGGEAKVIVDLSDSKTGIDLRREGRKIIVDFLDTELPPALERRYDVTDFGTLVDGFDVEAIGSTVRLTVMPTGRWEQSAYQADNRFIIEVKTVTEPDLKAARTKEQKYKGEKLSLNFQNIEVRSVLQVLADFTGLNIITSDTVGGNLTLRLKDVPWDQALDIILQAKGLDMRETGNVIWIAPRDELATKEKLELEAQQQIADLEPMVTESFQLNYQRAEDIKTLIGSGDQGLLSRRGSAVVDARTNTIFVQDIVEKLDGLRDLIKQIDVPVRQVLIEARIVEATDTFSRNLGVRFGYHDTTGTGSQIGAGTNRGLVGGGIVDTGFHSGQTTTVPDFLADSMFFNNPAPGAGGAAPGQFSLILMNEAMTRFLNLELTAIQADGKGKIISSPRVITADNIEASIEQGTEIPYQQATSSGATSVSFRKATLSLKVTPQITPDENVMMKLQVNKDSVGQDTAAGPSIDTKQVTTEVLVENGGTVGIGGIYEQTESDQTNKVPVLGDIPVLGWLFKQNLKRNDKRELLIFVTPRLVSEKTAVR